MVEKISARARKEIDRLNERYQDSDITVRFIPQARRALDELQKTADISGTCMVSLVHIVEALVARSSGVLDKNQGGQYLLHLLRRSHALDRIVGGALSDDARMNLIELATLVCIEKRWDGYPRPIFEPLQEPCWAFLKAIIDTKMILDDRTGSWREFFLRMRQNAVEGMPLLVACALVWCGVVDINRIELVDDDFAKAAGRERRWFNVSRVIGLKFLSQLFLFKNEVVIDPLDPLDHDSRLLKVSKREGVS